MSPIATALSLIVVMASVAFAWAGESEQIAARQTLEDFGVKTTACHEWTDRCAVCLRHDDGSFGCSLPGIACRPAPIACADASAPINPTKHQD